MSEIAKLRQRLLNANRNVTEYRMTIAEAKALIVEKDEALKTKKKPQIEAATEPAVILRTIDGGTL
jgi:hypothetical protein